MTDPGPMSAAMQALAAEAGAAWGGWAGSPQPVQLRENGVFRVVLRDGSAAALRLHRAGYHRAGAIAQELGICRALAAAGLACSEPLPTLQGALVTRLSDAKTEASLVRWIPGGPLGAVPDATLPLKPRYRALGALLAGFHRCADRAALPLSARPDWGVAALTGAGIWGDPTADPALRPEERDRMQHARAEAALRAARWPGVGLIHGDLLPDNILWAEGRMVLIDFDDCGPGLRLYDLATALISLADSPDLAPASQALCAGYVQAGGPVSAAEFADLPWALMLRAQASAAWALGRCAPGDPRRAAYRARALRLTDAALTLA